MGIQIFIFQCWRYYIKTGKDFDYKNVTDYKDITIKQVPMLIHVENKKDWSCLLQSKWYKKALE